MFDSLSYSTHKHNQSCENLAFLFSSCDSKRDVYSYNLSTEVFTAKRIRCLYGKEKQIYDNDYNHSAVG